MTQEKNVEKGQEVFVEQWSYPNGVGKAKVLAKALLIQLFDDQGIPTRVVAVEESDVYTTEEEARKTTSLKQQAMATAVDKGISYPDALRELSMKIA